jgi:16S rRNA (uracil1498-N3)-methyltransferase
LRTLFFIDPLPTSEEISLGGTEANHAIKVLRTNVDDEISLSDGKGNWAHCKVLEVNKKELLVKTFQRGRIEVESPKLVVFQAIPKSDRQKETIELMVEAGVDEIYPWNATRCIAKAQGDTKDKWEQTAFAAAKQARRYLIPTIGSPVNSPEFSTENLTLVLHESGDLKISEIVNSKVSTGCKFQAINLIIGPEGGITEEELASFEKRGAIIAKLGQPVFRSAHAASAGLAAVSALIGRW